MSNPLNIGVRYTIKSGRFGAYFYDEEMKTELDLYEVQALLNLPICPAWSKEVKCCTMKTEGSP